MRPTADDGLTDGLRREGCLVWNTALTPMVSLAETPLTGKPDAGNPPVRFGGRGSSNAALPTPILTQWQWGCGQGVRAFSTDKNRHGGFLQSGKISRVLRENHAGGTNAAVEAGLEHRSVVP